MNYQKNGADMENIDPNPTLELADKENQDKLFSEYYSSHKQEPTGGSQDGHQQLTENDISNQIDKEIDEDALEWLMNSLYKLTLQIVLKRSNGLIEIVFGIRNF